MRIRPALFLPTLAVLVTAAAAASAQARPAPPPGAAPAATQPGEPRKDPNGQTGISPYAEQINKGERAFVATDHLGATLAFQEAIKIDPERMLGFYRLGEAHLGAGKLEDAEAAWQTALSKKGTDDLQAKVLFVLADLRERQAKWQPAKDAWQAYTAFLQGHPGALGYGATSIERQKQADRRMDDENKYKPVKERIAARQAEREKEAVENAKKDKLNR